jgi:2-keto-3-deoxy-6-phosphogluconate aldolase
MTTFGFLNLPRPFVKVISGLSNTDMTSVTAVVNAAVEAGAHAVDVAANVEIVRSVKDICPLAVFASGLTAAELIDAANAGADVVELGNFDSVYAQGGSVDAASVVITSREVLSKLPAGVKLCATIPGKLSKTEQLDLATQLQAIGVSFLQVEVLPGLVDQAMTVARQIVGIVEVPVILAGGLTFDNLDRFVQTGVQGLGIGKAISSLQSEKAMVETLKALLVKSTKLGAVAAV